MEIQPIGEFHGEEVSASDGEKWLALVQDERGTLLLPAAIRVERIEDPLLDFGTDEITGKRISASGLPSAVLLLRGGRSLSPGPLTSASLTDAASGDYDPYSDSELTLGLGSRVYTLAIRHLRQPDDSVVAQLSLSTREVTQTLMVDPSGELGLWLLWAGDLDRDGALDLYLDLSTHYNLSIPTLLLSSEAKDGELVGKAASFTGAGC